MPSRNIPGECPEPDTLGRSGWNILHTAAAVYPNKPSTAQQDGMRKFIEGWSQVYACSHCAYHMRRHVAKHPPILKDKREASWYVCDMHNKVNKVLGKEEYDCDPDVVLKRWHPTFPNMEDTPTIEDQIEEIRRQEHEKKMQQAQQAPPAAAGGGGGGGFFSWFGGGKKSAATPNAAPPNYEQQQQRPSAASNYSNSNSSASATHDFTKASPNVGEEPIPAGMQRQGGRNVPIGSLSKIGAEELDANPRMQSRWGDKPVFEQTEATKGAVRSGWNESDGGAAVGSNPFESRMNPGPANSLYNGHAATSKSSNPILSGATPLANSGPFDSASLVPPPSKEDMRLAAQQSSIAQQQAVPSPAAVDNEADISEIMKKVRACAVYCPEKDKNKGVSLGGH